MSTQRVSVVIDGKEHVTEAAGKANRGLKGFTDKVPGYAKVMAGLTAAFFAVRGAIQAVSTGVRESFAAFDRYEGSLRKLEGTAKITGVPLATLSENADRARKEFQLSTAAANDFAIVSTLLARTAGDATRGYELLSKSIELGAARGYDAQQVMEALDLTLRNQDEGLDRLLNKNPQDIYDAWAEAAGRSAGKMTDTEKKLAIVNELLEAGGKVTGSYAAFLESAAGQQFILSNRLEDTRIVLGKAMAPMRTFAINLLGQALENSDDLTKSVGALSQSMATLGATLSPGFLRGLEALGFISVRVSASFEFASIVIRKFAAETTRVLYDWVESTADTVLRAGKVLQVFGVEFLAEAAQKTKAIAKKNRAEATATLIGLSAEWNQFNKKLADGTYGMAQDVTRSTSMVSAALEDMADSADDTGQAVDRASDRARVALRVVDTAAGITADALTELRQAGDRSLDPIKADQFAAGLQRAADRAQSVHDRVTGAGEATEDATDTARDLSREIAASARSGLELAGAFGVVDTDARAALGSVVTMGESLSRVLSGDMGGIGGVVGAAANLVQTMLADDGARRQLLRDNTRRLAELTDEIGNLDLGVSGDDFVAARDMLTRLVPQLDMSGSRSSFLNNAGAIVNALRGSGVSITDLETIGQQLGISINDSNGRLQPQALAQLLQALNAAEFGQFGTGFAGQLASVQSQFQVFRTDTRGQLNQLGALFSQFSPAFAGIDFTSLPQARLGLQNLFTQLQTGGLAPEAFGAITGQQALEGITTLLGLIGELEGGDGAVASASGGGGFASSVVVDAPMVDPVVAAIREQTAEVLPVLARTAVASETTALATTTIVQQLGGVQVDIVASGIDDVTGQLRDRLDDVLGQLVQESDRASGSAA